jgi:hypothetical protein
VYSKTYTFQSFNSKGLFCADTHYFMNMKHRMKNFINEVDVHKILDYWNFMKIHNTLKKSILTVCLYEFIIIFIIVKD